MDWGVRREKCPPALRQPKQLTIADGGDVLIVKAAVHKLVGQRGLAYGRGGGGEGDGGGAEMMRSQTADRATPLHPFISSSLSRDKPTAGYPRRATLRTRTILADWGRCFEIGKGQNQTPPHESVLDGKTVQKGTVRVRAGGDCRFGGGERGLVFGGGGGRRGTARAGGQVSSAVRRRPKSEGRLAGAGGSLAAQAGTVARGGAQHATWTCGVWSGKLGVARS